MNHFWSKFGLIWTELVRFQGMKKYTKSLVTKHYQGEVLDLGIILAKQFFLFGESSQRYSFSLEMNFCHNIPKTYPSTLIHSFW